MRTTVTRRQSRKPIWAVLLLFSLLLPLSACHPRGGIDLAPFKKMARDGICADLRNNLYVIDDRLVFWERAGECSDAAYAQSLFGSSPDESLCVFHDSIAGPVWSCRDPAYEDLFDTITENLDKPDLGLGAEHSVQPVRF